MSIVRKVALAGLCVALAGPLPAQVLKGRAENVAVTTPSSCKIDGTAANSSSTNSSKSTKIIVQGGAPVAQAGQASARAATGGTGMIAIGPKQDDPCPPPPPAPATSR